MKAHVRNLANSVQRRLGEKVQRRQRAQRMAWNMVKHRYQGLAQWRGKHALPPETKKRLRMQYAISKIRHLHSPIPPPSRITLKGVLKAIGPSLITGASDDDPSGIGTYAVTGASLGFRALWMALFTFPLMASVQFICAKIGMASGLSLAGVLRKHYPRPLLYTVISALMIANIITAGVDIGAVGAGIALVVPLPAIVVIVPLTLAMLAVQIWGSYQQITNIFKWLTLALFSYVVAAFFVRPDLGQVFRYTLIPTIRPDKAFLTTLVAVLGTTISPYLFFWQATQEVEKKRSLKRKVLWRRRGTTDEDLQYAAWDVNVGMLFSNLIMYFIILTTAATLFAAGKTDIQSAADAAEALRPLAGNAASLLLTIGLIGSGLLAVPILIGSAAYTLSEAMGWQFGFDKKLGQARNFYTVVVVATLIGMLINFLNINPIQALFWTSVINGFLAPPLLVMLMHIANNKTIMGKRVNGKLLNILGGITITLMFLALIALVLTFGQ